jgi:acetylornithine deacetylase/succinyl-diaminopimelate desuccinylase-like protein
MTPEQALTAIERCAHDDEIDSLLIDLLRFPSPQTDLLEADSQIKKFICDMGAPRVNELTGIAATVDAMGNLIWRLGGAGTDGLLLMAYAMTFPPAAMPEPFSGATIDGAPFGFSGKCALGRGACEQKGALAAMIYATALVARSKAGLRAPLTLAVSLAGETGRHDAARFMFEHDEINARSAIVGLGTANRICLGNKGRIDVEIIVRGKSAHSSMPWEGVNAIDGMRRVMTRLDSLSLGDAHPSLGRATLTMTHISSAPEIKHTIQELCRLTLDRRLLPGQEPDAALRDIRDALKGISGFSIEANAGAFMYPSEVSADCAVAKAVGNATQKVSKRQAEIFYSPAALDAGFLNHHGIETIMFGPGDLRLAHTDQDLVSLQEVRDAAKIYAVTALQLLA